MSETQTKKTVDAMKVFAAEAKGGRTTDGFANFISRLGLNEDNVLSAGTYEFNNVTRQRLKLEAAYRGSWVVGIVVDAIPEDMTRAGIVITTTDGADLKKLQVAQSRLKIWQSLCTLEKWSRLYGGAIGVLQIKGQNLATPLDPDTVAKDQFQGISVFDRWQLAPVLTELIPEGPDMGLPMYYDIVNNPASMMGTQSSGGAEAVGAHGPAAPSGVSIGQSVYNGGGRRVHYSRVIRSVGIELPYFQAITEMLWGESVLERLWDRLIAFDNVTMSAAQLVDRANLRHVGIDGLRDIIGTGGDALAGLVAMFDMMRSMQTNEGLTLLDKNDTHDSVAYSFTGLSDMMLQFGQQLSGASGIPLVRFFGQSPAGLSSTGESDLRLYYDGINTRQESTLRNPIEVVMKVLWRSTYGSQLPDDFEFTFAPLWQMSDTEKANNAKTTTETIIGAFDSGVTDKVTTLKELRDASADTGIFSNITDEAIEEAQDEIDNPPVPAGEIDPPNSTDPNDPTKMPGASPLGGPPKTPVPSLDSRNQLEKEDPKAAAPLTSFQKIKKWLSEN